MNKIFLFTQNSFPEPNMNKYWVWPVCINSGLTAKLIQVLLFFIYIIAVLLSTFKMFNLWPGFTLLTDWFLYLDYWNPLNSIMNCSKFKAGQVHYRKFGTLMVKLRIKIKQYKTNVTSAYNYMYVLQLFKHNLGACFWCHRSELFII
jgi:hypothetical protein